MKTTRLLSLLLCLLMLAGLMAACTQGGQTPSSAAAPSTPSASSQAEEPTITNADREKVKIRVLQYGLQLENVDYDNDPIKPLIEEAVNIELEYVTYPAEGYADTINRNMLAGTLPELFHNQGQAQEYTSQWASDGTVYKLSDYVNAEPDRYPILYKAMNSPEYKMINESYTGDGDSAYAWYTLGADPNSAWYVGDLTYNRKIMEECGFTEAPKTVDEFIEYGKKAGELGYIGWFPRNFRLGADNNGSFEYLDDCIAGPLGTFINPNSGGNFSGLMMGDDGVWYSTTTSEKSKEAMKIFAEMYKNGTLPQQLGVWGDWDEPYAAWANDELGAVSYAVRTPDAFRLRVKAYTDGNPDADVTWEDFVLGPVLQGPDGQYAAQYASTWSNSMNMFVPTSCDYPDRVLDLLEWLGTNESQQLRFRGIEGVHWTETADGGIEFNLEEWYKISNMYIGTDRVEYSPLCNSYSSTQKQIDFETNPSWFDAHTKIIDYTEYITGFDDLYTTIKPIVDANMNNTVVRLEPYYQLVKYPEEVVPMRAAIAEIALDYIPAFITGQRDIDAEWAEYTRKMEEAGMQDVVDAFNKAVQDAKAIYDKYQ